MGYVFAVASIFLPLSVLPALTFFKIAYDEEMMLVVRHGQLQIARAVEQRDRRVKDQYFSVQIDKEKQFLEKRLNLDPCEGLVDPLRLRDTYTSFFLTPVCAVAQFGFLQLLLHQQTTRMVTSLNGC